jgi:excisionase family DNA binding protein
MRDLLTTAEAADYLRCKPRTVSHYCRTGVLKYRKIGRGYLIEANEIRRFLGEPVCRPITQEAPESRVPAPHMQKLLEALRKDISKEARHGTR